MRTRRTSTTPFAGSSSSARTTSRPLRPDGRDRLRLAPWLSIGWDPRELAGVAIQDLIHPDDLGAAAAAGEKLFTGSNVDAVTVRLRAPTGAYTWFDINGSQVLGEDGELRFVLGTARDMSEREELRSRLRDLDAVYRFADAVAGRASSSRCSTPRSTRCSRRRARTGRRFSCATTRTSCASARGAALSDEYRSATDGHSVWAPDEANPQQVLVEDAAAAGFEPWLEDIVRNEGIAALAFFPLVRRGRLLGKFMLYRNAPHAWSDREFRLARTIANHLASVTERTRAQQELHESREQLATILRAVDEGITVADTAGRLLYANDASARQFGKASVEELLASPREEWMERFELFDVDGAMLDLDLLPSRRAYSGEEGSKSSCAVTARRATSGGSTCGRLRSSVPMARSSSSSMSRVTSPPSGSPRPPVAQRGAGSLPRARERPPFRHARLGGDGCRDSVACGAGARRVSRR